MSPNSPQNVLAGGGEMGALMRSIDWSRTPVGAVETWPQSLRTALSILLETGFPMYIAWGPAFTQFYNDSYRPILGSTKHPAAMGGSTRESFAEIWDIIGPMFEGVMNGRPTTVVDFLLPLDRDGFVEECYFMFSYSPIREEKGNVGGVLVTVAETSKRVIGERRMATSQRLAAKTRDARTVAEACERAAEVIGESAADIPMALIYLVSADGRTARRVAGVGLDADRDPYPALVDLEQDGDRWGIARAVADGLPHTSPSPVPPAPPGRAATSPARLMALPIVEQGEDRAFGVLLALTSHALSLDDGYAGFLSLIASQIGAAIASARALEEAQARVDGLAELNRAKTVFFDNVSHEFRTPLTLMLGPTEHALASADRALRGDDPETVYRNALRLQKLANTLLDFSRIEAGRMDAAFEPADLALLTRDQAGAFASAIERAGLELVVDCPALAQPIFVDTEMWTKVVLNLVSNAFKFTLEGGITVSLRGDESGATLVVRDTGVGIAAADVPRIFGRFYRAERVNARTHEGSGIGLALVRELVEIHGGTITVQSALGEGARFTVHLPAGSAHLPASQVRLEPRPADPASAFAARSFVAEALRWLPDAPAVTGPLPQAGASSQRILVADDSADMRDYVSRLLSPRWTVETVGNGAEALAAIRRLRPALVISDIMMPVVDGFQLLRQLRSDPETRTIPFVLLSARAGEDERIDGLSLGADDCLVKPFSARELIARVESQLTRAQVRSLEEAHAVRLASVFAHAPVGVAILRGRDHVFEFANRPYLELVGRRHVVGRPLREALPDVAAQVIELLDDVFDSGEPYVGRSVRLILEQRGDAAEEAFFDFVYQPLFEESGIVSGIAVVAFEVTQLASARRDAEAANRAKDEFLAMLGHELRNPLAPILTALQLMRLRGIEGAERERAIIERQVTHMVGLVDDLLDVSRITRGKVQLKRSRVDLADLVAKAIEMTGPAIEERRHTLRVEVSKGLLVDGDPARLSQVIANLLTNAAKYTDPGGRIQVLGGVHEGHALIRVIDTGIGIAPEMLTRVFDLFSQERQNIDRSQGGLGLGLAIVRSLVQAHGGSVSARSEGDGKGSEFQFRIPLARQEAQAERSKPLPGAMPAAGSRRILVVDDNLDAAELLADSLSAMGHEARVAFDGPSAMEVAQAFTPDVALLDLGLPVMDGFELAERLKADPKHGALTLIAVTGYGQDLDRQRTQSAGFQAHMVKPVDLAHLDQWLRSGAPGPRGTDRKA
jgi:signal transduction histidine kinase